VAADGPAADEATHTPAPRARRVPVLPRGTCVGRYVIVDALGAGGMGVVYSAYDPELDRRVALKLVRDTSDPQRLLHEAQALARVSHPNVIAVHDVGTFEGAVFVAMELVEGRTLGAWRAQTAPGRREILDVFLAAGRGLAAAHHAGIVHRDFKPSNVMVGDDGRVRVLDFGLARGAPTAKSSRTLTPGAGASSRSGPSALPPESGALADEATLASDGPARPGRSLDPSQPSTKVDRPRAASPLDDIPTVTDSLDPPQMHASRVMGTPSYMAPEQRRAGAFDARVDQFSFAVALHEALYDERPFRGDTQDEVAANAAAGRVRPPARGSDVPPWLRKILLRGLAPDPGDRFPTMDAMLAALEADPARRRRQVAVIAVAAGLVGLAAFGIARREPAAGPCQGAARDLATAWSPEVAATIGRAFAATGRPHAADTQRRVVALLNERGRSWTAMRREACEATHVRGEQSAELLDRRMACLDRRRDELGALARALTAAPAPVDQAVDAALALPDLDACADREALLAALPLPAAPAARAAIEELRRRIAEASALAHTGQYRAALARAREIATAADSTAFAPLIAEAQLLIGTTSVDGGGGAQPGIDALYRAAARAAESRDDLLAARIWIALVGAVGADQTRPAEGLALARVADAAITRAGGTPLLRASLRHQEAMVLEYAGDLPAAIEREREALAVREQVLGADDLVVSHSVNSLGALLSDRGDYAGAEALHRRALAIRRAALGPSHPVVADSLNNLGVVAFHQGKLDEAQRLYREALAVRLAALGERHHDVGTSYNNIGGLAMDRRDWPAAEEALSRALATWEAALGPDHADLGIPLVNLGDVALQQRNFARALPLCTRALAIETRAGGADNPALAWSLTCQGEAHLGLRAAREAIPILERARALREASPGDPGELARTRLALARALWDGGGDRGRARELGRQAAETFASLGAVWAPRRAEATAWLAAH
jgi:serine/threonine protein kinase/tetratricopeptide (TPR) repeat protein